MSERKQAWVEGAGIVLDQLFSLMPFDGGAAAIGSAVDFGCGPGAWLAALDRRSIPKLEGFDLLKPDPMLFDDDAPEHVFYEQDLTRPVEIAPEHRFDLALCLEVAEHLPAEAAPTLVETLIRASNLILFSAAIPGQGGDGHVNEHWPSYWTAQFKYHGYAVADAIRWQIWEDERVLWWYRQNAFVAFNPLVIKWIKPGNVPDVAHPLAYDSARRR